MQSAVPNKNLIVTIQKHTLKKIHIFNLEIFNRANQATRPIKMNMYRKQDFWPSIPYVCIDLKHTHNPFSYELE